MRKQIAAANWKMNLTIQQAVLLTEELISKSRKLSIGQEVVLGVPFPYLTTIKGILSGTERIFISAQNCSEKKNGANTGEVSTEMLHSIGVTHVIIGHSERREYFHESNAVLSEKVNRCLEIGLIPIFCCGEPLSVRESGNEFNYVETQLKEGLFHLNAQQLFGFIIAYEPIWAIGTGKTATSDQAQQMHAYIRKVMSAQYDPAVAESISILYGGSVKSSNAVDLFGQPDVDGGLVGGASLVNSEFSAIIDSLKE